MSETMSALRDELERTGEKQYSMKVVELLEVLDELL